MEGDSESTATSIDESTENDCDNPTGYNLAEGLMSLIKPAVDQLDERVKATKISQLELKQSIDSLAEELKKISESQKTPIDIETYVKKLIDSKNKIVLLSNVLQSTQERLNRLHIQIEKETAKRKLLVTPTAQNAKNEPEDPKVQPRDV